MASPGQIMRDLINAPEILIMPGVYDGFSVRLVESMGFKAAGISGAGLSETNLGWADLGIMGYEENLRSSAALAACCAIPLQADGDTGYGNAVNVHFTVQGFERAGLAGLMLEDQVWPKRCGHLAGKDVIGVDQFGLALQAAVEARRDPDTVIIARTDARAPLGIEEAISRANRYASLGADVIFVEAPQSLAEIEQIAAEVDAPLLLNVVPGGRTPEIAHARLVELGYRIAIHPGVALAAVVPAAVEALSRLREQAPSRDGAVGPESFFDLFGLSAWNELGQRYENTKQ